MSSRGGCRGSRSRTRRTRRSQPLGSGLATRTDGPSPRSARPGQSGPRRHREAFRLMSANVVTICVRLLSLTCWKCAHQPRDRSPARGDHRERSTRRRSRSRPDGRRTSRHRTRGHLRDRVQLAADPPAHLPSSRSVNDARAAISGDVSDHDPHSHCGPRHREVRFDHTTTTGTPAIGRSRTITCRRPLPTPRPRRNYRSPRRRPPPCRCRNPQNVEASDTHRGPLSHRGRVTRPRPSTRRACYRLLAH